ncbi:hypothetical protein CIPAW_02G046800 [Carya illinoinensis]|uniref:Uncharacterized protein n=1 Tax=Carya illinoinensis TaxID=32201 RepID=A0A8T1RCG6_CARIL|nr:hypothetical protein CIPAW_02G046800 [Carya illinoinensis]
MNLFFNLQGPFSPSIVHIAVVFHPKWTIDVLNPFPCQ